MTLMGTKDSSSESTTTNSVNSYGPVGQVECPLEKFKDMEKTSGLGRRVRSGDRGREKKRERERGDRRGGKGVEKGEEKEMNEGGVGCREVQGKRELSAGVRKIHCTMTCVCFC